MGRKATASVLPDISQGLGLDVLIRLIRSAGIHEVMPGGQPVPGKVTRILRTGEMSAVVTEGIKACLRAVNAFEGVPLKIWEEQTLFDDASWQEEGVLCRIFEAPHSAASSRCLYSSQLRFSF